MKVHNNKYNLFVTLVSFMILSVLIHTSFSSERQNQPEQKTEDISVKRASKTLDGINFCLTVIPGNTTQKTFAIVTITNMSDNEVIVPTPDVMPLAGTIGYKNTIEIRKENGDSLKMTGLHADYAGRPTTTLRAIVPDMLIFHSRTWLFELEDNFIGLTEPGRYIVDFCLISEESEHNKSTWKGKVDLSVTINKGGPYRIEPSTSTD